MPRAAELGMRAAWKRSRAAARSPAPQGMPDSMRRCRRRVDGRGRRAGGASRRRDRRRRLRGRRPLARSRHRQRDPGVRPVARRARRWRHGRLGPHVRPRPGRRRGERDERRVASGWRRRRDARRRRGGGGGCALAGRRCGRLIRRAGPCGSARKLNMDRRESSTLKRDKLPHGVPRSVHVEFRGVSMLLFRADLPAISTTTRCGHTTPRSRPLHSAPRSPDAPRT